MEEVRRSRFNFLNLLCYLEIRVNISLIGFCLQVPQLIFGPAEPDPPLTIIESPPPPRMAPEPEQLSSDKSEGEDVATAIQALLSFGFMY